MLAQLRLLFGNPKFLTMLIGLIVALGVKFGLQLDNQIIGMIVGLVAITIGAQAHVMAAQAAPAPRLLEPIVPSSAPSIAARPAGVDSSSPGATAPTPASFPDSAPPSSSSP